MVRESPLEAEELNVPKGLIVFGRRLNPTSCGTRVSTWRELMELR